MIGHHQQMKISKTRQFTFQAAHYLEGHTGMFGHIHGHSWKLDVTITSPSLLESGVERGTVIDCERFETLVRPVVDQFNHCMIVESLTHVFRESGQINLEVPERTDARMQVIGVRPTCENIAKVIWDRIRTVLPVHVELTRLKLVETESSWVEIEK
jgi:6-pyruvoyltetrahydropterin/6-carboxytetrahydropterin synthase